MPLFNGCLWRWPSEATDKPHECKRAANALRMMKAERLSGDRATRATPGDAEVMGKVGSAPLWPRISRRRSGRRRTDPTLEGRRKPLSLMKRECTYLNWKPPEPDFTRMYRIHDRILPHTGPRQSAPHRNIPTITQSHSMALYTTAVWRWNERLTQDESPER